MGWVSQTSYIYGWANGGKPGPGTTVVYAPVPPAPSVDTDASDEE
jgi:hypothetical protein